VQPCEPRGRPKIASWNLLYVASLRIVDFVLLHKVPEKKTGRHMFCGVLKVFGSFDCKISGHRPSESVTFTTQLEVTHGAGPAQVPARATGLDRHRAVLRARGDGEKLAVAGQCRRRERAADEPTPAPAPAPIAAAAPALIDTTTTGSHRCTERSGARA